MKRCDYPPEDLADTADGTATPSVTAAVDAHTRSCATCAATLAHLQRLQRTFETLRDAAPAGDAVARARALFRERRPARPNLLARLIADSRGTLTLAGARGGDSDFELTFAADGFEIVVWQEREAADRWYLIVQARRTADRAILTPTRAELRQGDATGATASVEGTEMHLAGIVAGTYALHIAVDEAHLEIPEVEVGA